jgi:predicted nucleotidyltransferase
MSTRRHLAPPEAEALETFVQRLLAAHGQDVTDVRLFGSKARGDAHPDSDLDVLVLVTRSDYALKHTILWLAAEVSLAFDVLLSPRVIPVRSWQRMVEANTLFYRSVAADSIPLIPSAAR